MSVLGRHQGGGVIAVTLLIALLLGIVPLPEGLRAWRPDWALLALLYWSLALPQRIGVGIGWLTGLLQDVLTGTLLGQHALAYAVAVYLVIKLHQRIRLYPLWQQSLSILVLLTLAQLLMLWINGIIGRPIHAWLYWVPSLVGALLWPLVFSLLRRLRRGFRVS
ncbi:rod shape-determining protein MreD [Thiohalobacter sp. IOR34]|uniref:rod shape-determining protein MreD n=1 Tax=Thiohalobacter sp. IOR34 TaxID=3057176 RepID=UPI0025B10552|nr:rod shape-determining protein MreD [Thiohalobacter sp. IOR34]WJW75932.1 rod shape-determining protein MreD [Thiohalobacter sp. IOR34]